MRTRGLSGKTDRTPGNFWLIGALFGVLAFSCLGHAAPSPDAPASERVSATATAGGEAACAKGGCSRSFENNGCGGMDASHVQ